MRPEDFDYVGIATRIRVQAALAEQYDSLDHALDVVWLAAEGYRHTEACNKAVKVLIKLGHWTEAHAREQGYL